MYEPLRRRVGLNFIDLFFLFVCLYISAGHWDLKAGGAGMSDMCASLTTPDNEIFVMAWVSRFFVLSPENFT